MKIKFYNAVLFVKFNVSNRSLFACTTYKICSRLDNAYH
jgi:hypothetical protein